MRPITLLFFAVATLCLGSIAWQSGGPAMLAALFNRPESGLFWQLVWGWSTLFLALVFFILSAYAAIESRGADE